MSNVSLEILLLLATTLMQQYQMAKRKNKLSRMKNYLWWTTIYSLCFVPFTASLKRNWFYLEPKSQFPFQQVSATLLPTFNTSFLGICIVLKAANMEMRYYFDCIFDYTFDIFDIWINTMHITKTNEQKPQPKQTSETKSFGCWPHKNPNSEGMNAICRSTSSNVKYYNCDDDREGDDMHFLSDDKLSTLNYQAHGGWRYE